MMTRLVKGQMDSESSKWSHNGPLDVHAHEFTAWGSHSSVQMLGQSRQDSGCTLGGGLGRD